MLNKNWMLGLACTALLAASLSARAADGDAVVPADKEPRHVPKLVNEWVRVVDVEIPEGEQTLYHTHSLDYPYVLMSSVTLYNQILGQPPKDAKMEAGFIGYYDAITQGAYTHRFINRGPGTFRAIGIELLKPAQPPAIPLEKAEPAPAVIGMETVLDNDRVRAYRIKLEPGAVSGAITVPGPSVRVAVSDGRISEKTPAGEDIVTDLAPAQFQFREKTTSMIITNTGDKPVELVEFMLK